MAKNLITGWESDSRELNLHYHGAGCVDTADLSISQQELDIIVPHIISPIYGRTREFFEYFH